MEIMPYVVSSVIALVLCTILGAVLPPWLTYILVGVCSLFMICLVLIQRGRGGGLAGAFGGVGGSSAFGTRAGDVFTRITIVTASVWIALNMGLVLKVNSGAGVSALAPEGTVRSIGEMGPGPLGLDADPTPVDVNLATPPTAPAGTGTGTDGDAGGLPSALDDEF